MKELSGPRPHFLLGLVNFRVLGSRLRSTLSSSSTATLHILHLLVCPSFLQHLLILRPSACSPSLATMKAIMMEYARKMCGLSEGFSGASSSPPPPLLPAPTIMPPDPSRIIPHPAPPYSLVAAASDTIFPDGPVPSSYAMLSCSPFASPQAVPLHSPAGHPNILELACPTPGAIHISASPLAPPTVTFSPD